MATGPKATQEDWASYLALYESLNGRLQNTDWFGDGWETEFRFIDQDSPRVIFLLRKPQWCSGHIYFKTRLTNADLLNQTTRVGLHVETSLQEDGINRVKFDNHLLMWGSEWIQGLDGYIIKPTHYQEPLHTYIPFTPATLVLSLFEEFTKLHNIAPIIDRAIVAATLRKPSRQATTKS